MISQKDFKIRLADAQRSMTQRCNPLSPRSVESTQELDRFLVILEGATSLTQNHHNPEVAICLAGLFYSLGGFVLSHRWVTTSVFKTHIALGHLVVFRLSGMIFMEGVSGEGLIELRWELGDEATELHEGLGSFDATYFIEKVRQLDQAHRGGGAAGEGLPD